MHIAAALFLVLAANPATAPSGDLLDQGFKDMYNLAFNSAHQSFEHFESINPGDPVGPVADAAAYLFSEFDRLNILQAEFFVDNQTYLHRPRTNPSPELKRKFEQALTHTKVLCDSRLAKSPNDEDALFANVLRLGLAADYMALINKQNLAALGVIKQATQAAEDLLRRYPNCYDAYIAIGIENYLLSLKPAPVRWFLHATGAQTDRQTGIEKLQLTASKGRYLQPYASLLLAVAALRDKNNAEARRLLSGLAQSFPLNPLYREEINQIR